jgi:hypothetical protein
LHPTLQLLEKRYEGTQVLSLELDEALHVLHTLGGICLRFGRALEEPLGELLEVGLEGLCVDRTEQSLAKALPASESGSWFLMLPASVMALLEEVLSLSQAFLFSSKSILHWAKSMLMALDCEPETGTLKPSDAAASVRLELCTSPLASKELILNFC